MIRQRLSFAAAFALSMLLTASIAYAQGSQLDSPLSSDVSSIPNFIATVLKAIVMIALPIITLFIVYAGFRFIAAQGNQGKLTEAKDNFKWVIVGAIFILGAWVLATLIAGTVNQLTRG